MNKDKVTPESLLWELTLKAKEVNEIRKQAYKDLALKAGKYYSEKSHYTVSDNIVGLKSQTLRDAEVQNIMEQMDIFREYGEAKLYAGEIEKDWEWIELVSKNCRALVFAKAETKEVSE